MSASVSKKELQGVDDEGNENKSGETMGLANRNGNEEAPRETKTVNLLTSQTGKVVGLRLDCTDREFSRQCVEDAMYANKHNQTSGQRWLERRRKRRRWRYDEVRRRCTMTTEERRSVKAEGLIDSFPTRNRLQGSR